MDVNEHEMLSDITLRDKLKERNILFWSTTTQNQCKSPDTAFDKN